MRGIGEKERRIGKLERNAIGFVYDDPKYHPLLQPFRVCGSVSL